MATVSGTHDSQQVTILLQCLTTAPEAHVSMQHVATCVMYDQFPRRLQVLYRTMILARSMLCQVHLDHWGTTQALSYEVMQASPVKQPQAKQSKAGQKALYDTVRGLLPGT